MGKYIPVQTNRGVTGAVLIEISDKTIPGLVLPEVVYNVKKKLGCIFVENHNSEPLMLKRATVFSSLDACGAYHAVRYEHGSRACTSF